MLGITNDINWKDAFQSIPYLEVLHLESILIIYR